MFGLIHEHGNYYYVQGSRLHRIDGPAIEFHDGSKYWFMNDRPHRRCGPAIERADCSCEWWYDGIQETRKENCVRERLRIKQCLTSIRVYIPVESSGSLRFPLVDLIIDYL
jgi:hypothetical protein